MSSASGTLYIVGTPIAFVSAANGATLDPNEILLFSHDRLSDHKIPREIRVMDAVLRTASGKIAKLELKKYL